MNKYTYKYNYQQAVHLKKCAADKHLKKCVRSNVPENPNFKMKQADVHKSAIIKHVFLGGTSREGGIHTWFSDISKWLYNAPGAFRVAALRTEKCTGTLDFQSLNICFEFLRLHPGKSQEH